jgi:hypothetical protein
MKFFDVLLKISAQNFCSKFQKRHGNFAMVTWHSVSILVVVVVGVGVSRTPWKQQ